MLRLFVALTLLYFNLYGCNGAYSSCLAKVKDSHSIREDTLSLPISKTTRLCYALHEPNAKILKQDLFLGIYLVKEKEPFAYPFEISDTTSKKSAIVDKQSVCDGTILKHQVGLNQLATYSKKALSPAIITNSCCFLEALVTQRGVIEKAYLKHFVESKSSIYGDSGIRVEDKKGGTVVVASDPFFKNNPFRVGDVILMYDGTKVKSAAQLMQKILFSSVGTKHSVKLKREGHLKVVHVITAKRYGGGLLSDTFLESQGLYFDKQLMLLKVEKSFKLSGIKVGDKLVAINGVRVKNQKELRHYLQKYKNYSKLLIERNHFQFFVNIK